MSGEAVAAFELGWYTGSLRIADDALSQEGNRHGLKEELGEAVRCLSCLKTYSQDDKIQHLISLAKKLLLCQMRSIRSRVRESGHRGVNTTTQSSKLRLRFESGVRITAEGLPTSTSSWFRLGWKLGRWPSSRLFSVPISTDDRDLGILLRKYPPIPLPEHILRMTEHSEPGKGLAGAKRLFYEIRSFLKRGGSPVVDSEQPVAAPDTGTAQADRPASSKASKSRSKHRFRAEIRGIWIYINEKRFKFEPMAFNYIKKLAMRPGVPQPVTNVSDKFSATLSRAREKIDKTLKELGLRDKKEREKYHWVIKSERNEGYYWNDELIPITVIQDEPKNKK